MVIVSLVVPLLSWPVPGLSGFSVSEVLAVVVFAVTATSASAAAAAKVIFTVISAPSPIKFRGSVVAVVVLRLTLTVEAVTSTPAVLPRRRK